MHQCSICIISFVQCVWLCRDKVLRYVSPLVDFFQSLGPLLVCFSFCFVLIFKLVEFWRNIIKFDKYSPIKRNFNSKRYHTEFHFQPGIISCPLIIIPSCKDNSLVRRILMKQLTNFEILKQINDRLTLTIFLQKRTVFQAKKRAVSCTLHYCVGLWFSLINSIYIGNSWLTASTQ